MDDLPDQFSGLPIRPPTPPKEFASDDVVPNIEQTFESIRLQPETLNTPNESPASVSKCPLNNSVKSTKHVGFSPLSPQFGSSGYLSFAGPLRSVPPSRECASRKSILKACEANITDLSNVELKGAAEMLESLCRGLASPTKSARLDAYMTLFGCLKTYKDVPERDLLEKKVSLLSDFVKRDISTDAEDIVDTQIRVQSLKLLSIFLAEPFLSNTLPQDFQSYIVDRAVKVLEEHTASKAIVNLHMIVLATQDFRPSVLTEAKALDILAALEDLTDHVKGNTIVSLRQRIYQRLLRQSKAAMIKCVNVWASHLFSAMLATNKETRLQALNFGREASMTFGTLNRVSNSVQDIFNRRSPTGKKFLSTVTKRLTDMISNDVEKTDVPPVWGIVVMFLRSRPRQLEHWEYMKEWMVIIQKCFNSSSSMVKHNAALAWNCLICAVDLSTSTSAGMIRTLKQPIKAQLERSSLQKTSHRTKQVAYSSYCTLLYYAFRPQRPANLISLFWEEFVEGILFDDDSLVNNIDSEYIFQVFAYLFDSGQPWNEKRVAEDPPIRPKDLSSLPPSWVHENASRILSIFQPLIFSAKWETANGEDPWVVKAWNSFMNAIGQASSKEIKISMETMNAVAGIMNCLRRYWTMESGDQVTRLKRILVLWKLANADKIHSLAFTECRLTGSCRGIITAAATPSTHTDQDRGSSNRSSAVAFFMKLLCSNPTFENSKATLTAVLDEVLGIAVITSSSRQNTLKIIKDVTSDLVTRADYWEPDCILWQISVDSFEKFVDGTKKFSTNGSSSRTPASDFQEMIEVLELGLQLGFKPAWSWQHTITKLADSISQEVGKAGLATAFIEPLASTLQRLWFSNLVSNETDNLEWCNNILECTVALMRNVVWPTSPKDLQDASLLVWGTASKRPVPLSVDPYITLYPLVATGLAKGFQYGRYLVAEGHSKLLEVAISLIRSFPVPLSLKMLKAIQSGVAMWINDEFHTENMQSQDTLALWKACAERVERLPTFNTVTARALEPLFVSALRTSHPAILEDALELWKATFGLKEDIIVPGSVSEALTWIQEGEAYEGIGSAKSHFNDKMDVEKNICDCSTNTENDIPALEMSFSKSPKAKRPNLDDKLTRVAQGQRTHRPIAPMRHTTPKSSPRSRRSGHTPPKRLRHEDSQIVFAAIHSSPYDTESLVSQFLTPHQREVRERQQLEANAMFPDIRSDPISRSIRKARKNHNVAMENIDSEPNRSEECSPPISSTKKAVITGSVQSSPTPGPRRHASSGCLPQHGPPSSPPAGPTNNLLKIDYDQAMELPSPEDHMKGVTNQGAKIPNATEPLVDEDSDAEPSFPGSATRDLHKTKPITQYEDAEPSLPELLHSKIPASGAKLEKENVIRPSAPTTPVKGKGVENEVREQASPSKSIATKAQSSELGGALPDSSYLKTQGFLDTSLAEHPASDMDVYVDAPSSLQSTPSKNREQRGFEHVRQNREGQWVMVASTLHRQYDAASDVEDSTKGVQAHKDQIASQDIGDFLVSSDIDEQVSQQIAADMERALTQVEQARQEESSSDAPNKSSPRKRKLLASKSPEKPMRKSPRRRDVKVIIKKLADPSQENYQEPAANENEILDCIKVATPPYQEPAKRSLAHKLRRNSARSTPKSRERSSVTPSTSKRRCSSRLSQMSGRGGSFYLEERDKARSHEKASPRSEIASAQEDRGGPNTDGPSHPSSPAQEKESLAGSTGATHLESIDSSSALRIQEAKGEMCPSTTNFPTSFISSPQESTPTDERCEMVHTRGRSLLLKLQALVEEAKNVVLDHGEQRTLLSTWMNLGHELHHADAVSRATKHS